MRPIETIAAKNGGVFENLGQKGEVVPEDVPSPMAVWYVPGQGKRLEN